MFLIVAAGLSSCTKEGPVGKDGKDGADGRDGNANVYSTEITIYSQDWQNNNGIYGAGSQISQITQDVIDNGTVLAYYKDANNTYFAIPYGSLSYSFTTGLIVFITTSQTFTQNTNIFKVVVIGGAPASSVNVNDYNDVANYYGLDDN